MWSLKDEKLGLWFYYDPSGDGNDRIRVGELIEATLSLDFERATLVGGSSVGFRQVSQGRYDVIARINAVHEHEVLADCGFGFHSELSGKNFTSEPVTGRYFQTYGHFVARDLSKICPEELAAGARHRMHVEGIFDYNKPKAVWSKSSVPRQLDASEKAIDNKPCLLHGMFVE